MRVLNRHEAADLLKVPVRTVDYWVSTDQIPFSRLGKRCVRFDQERLAEWFKAREGIAYHHGTDAE